MTRLKHPASFFWSPHVYITNAGSRGCPKLWHREVIFVFFTRQKLVWAAQPRPNRENDSLPVKQVPLCLLLSFFSFPLLCHLSYWCTLLRVQIQVYISFLSLMRSVSSRLLYTVQLKETILTITCFTSHKLQCRAGTSVVYDSNSNIIFYVYTRILIFMSLLLISFSVWATQVEAGTWTGLHRYPYTHGKSNYL